MWTWFSDAFGTDAANSNPSGAGTFAHNLRFPGQLFDGQVGLHSNGYRDFDPATGRYVESDPMGLFGGINTYAYAYGNPLNIIDPLGLWGFGDPLPQSVVNIAAGFGDGVSFGATAFIRELSDTNDVVDTSSAEYVGAVVAGLAVNYIGYETGAELAIGDNFRIAPWGNRTGHKFGRFPHYHRRGCPDADGKTPPGQGIGRHRPWEAKSPDKNWWDRF
jgi:RHS repeat-associated protein